MGDVPFHEVYIHGLIRDQDGQKMSKSKGNILDPLDLIDGIDLESLVRKRTTGLMQPQMAPKIEAATKRQFPNGIPEFGTDALRFTFAALASNGRDIRFDLGRIEGYRNFCNKLWNAARYVMLNVTEPPAGAEPEFSLADRWIRSRLGHTLREFELRLGEYRLDLASRALYEFTWNEYCDWYLELAKPVLQGGGSPAERLGTRLTLVQVLEALLRCLHPIMPFITEEIWQKLGPLAGVSGDTIMTQAFPEADGFPADAEAETELDWIRAFILGLRQIRGEMDISPGKALPVLLKDADESAGQRVERHRRYLVEIGRIESLQALSEGAEPPPSATALLDGLRILVPMAGLIDVAAERERLAKKLDKVRAELKRVEGKLGNQRFVDNAPAEVVDKERRKAEAAREQITQLEAQLGRLDAIN
jgi:valyl-tRNA synthetase